MNKKTLVAGIIIASFSTQAMAFSLIGPLFQAGAKAVTNLAGAAVDKVRGSDKEKEAKEATEARVKYEQQAAATYQSLPEEQRKAAIDNAMAQYDKLHNFVAAVEAQQQAQRAQAVTAGGIASSFVGDVAKGAIGQKVMLDAAEASAKAGVGNRISSGVVNAASASGSDAAKGGALAAALDKSTQDKVLNIMDKVSNPGKTNAEIAATNAAKLQEVQEKSGFGGKLFWSLRHNSWASFKSPRKPVEPVKADATDSQKETAAPQQTAAQ